MIARNRVRYVLSIFSTGLALSLGGMHFAACQAAGPPSDSDDGSREASRAAAASAAITLEDGRATPLIVGASDFAVEATLEEYLVGIDDLAQAKAQARLLDTGRKVNIMNGNGYRSAVFMRKASSGWVVSQINGKDLGDALGNTLSTLRAKVRADNGDFFLVDVHGLHLMLVGHRENGALVLTVPSDRPDLSLTANASIPASELFPRLAVEARMWTAETAKMFAGH